MLSLTCNILIISEKPFISLDYRNGSVVEATAGQKSVKLLVKVSAFPMPVTQWYAQEFNCSKKKDIFTCIGLFQYWSLHYWYCNYTFLLCPLSALSDRRDSRYSLIEILSTFFLLPSSHWDDKKSFWSNECRPVLWRILSSAVIVIVHIQEKKWDHDNKAATVQPV